MRQVHGGILLLALLGSSGALTGQERTFRPVSWDLMWEIPPALDSPIFLPWALYPLSDGSIVLYDHGDDRVKRFSPPGRLEWSIGGTGEGPGEFLGITDLKVDAADRIWVLDRDDRVTELDAETGKVISTSRAGRMHRLQPLPSGDLVGLFDPAGRPLLAVLDEQGAAIDWSPPGFNRDMTAIQREGYIDGFRSAPTALIAFRRSGNLVLLHETDQGVRGEMVSGIEPLAFPGAVSWSTPGGAVVERPDPRAFEAALWIGHDEDFFYVGFAGEAGTRDVVDLYDTRSGRYSGSVRLPMEIENGAVLGRGVVAGLVQQPVPHIQVWRLQYDSKERTP